MKSKPIERLREFADQHQVAPPGMTIASDRPMQMGEVVVVAGFRFMVAQQLTEPEFRRRIAANRANRMKDEQAIGEQFGEKPGDGSFMVTADRGIAEPGSDRAAPDGPDPDQRYFYSVRRLPGRSGT